jgi:opacity protein-like surface antigen
MKILLCIVGVSALSILASWTAASAADMPVKAKAPPAPPYSWQGFYIGAYAGAAWSDQATTSDPCLTTAAAACAAAGTGTYNGVRPSVYHIKPSFTGGGEIGYNWQPNPYTVLGLENKFGYMRLKGSYVMNPPGIGNGDTTAFTTLGNWYDAYTARVGIVDGRVMFFFEAGGATAKVSTGVVDATPPTTIDTTHQQNGDRLGWRRRPGIRDQFALEHEGRISCSGYRQHSERLRPGRWVSGRHDRLYLFTSQRGPDDRPWTELPLLIAV